MWMFLTISVHVTISWLTIRGCHGLENHYHHQHALLLPKHQSHYQQIPLNEHELYGQHYESHTDHHCELYKVGLVPNTYPQYVQYKIAIPDLKEFTLCTWTSFRNHSADHPIFSYSVNGQPRAIYSWIANSEQSSYISMAVDGQTFYRLNYPLKTNKWYHMCQSWNGKTGEWQVWVKAERVGRGFHNRLVGHVIPSGGIAISGADLMQLESGVNQYHPLVGHQLLYGMNGEITMVQLYKIALTAGKAHKDHKHHHAHQYDHYGNQITTTPQPTTPRIPPLPTHPLLTNGQINPQTKLNLANQQPNIQTALANYFDIGNDPYQYVDGANVYAIPQQQQQQQQQPIIGAQYQQLLKFKRSIQYPKTVSKRELVVGGGHFIENSNGYVPNDHLQYNSVVTSAAATDTGQYVLIPGLAEIGDNQPVLHEQKKDEREPAEAEVKAVLSVCSGCDIEPFAKALVFAWREVPKKLFSGALYLQAVPDCQAF